MGCLGCASVDSPRYTYRTIHNRKKGRLYRHCLYTSEFIPHPGRSPCGTHLRVVVKWEIA